MNGFATHGALARQQAALLTALVEGTASSAEAVFPWMDPRGAGLGLAAYRGNASATAVRALGAAYPVVAALLGDEGFDAVARGLWRQSPPAVGDLAHWGAELAAFLDACEALSDEPYLGDVARAEWALHAMATRADRAIDLGSLQLLVTDDPDAVCLRLAPGLGWTPSRFPLVSLVQAHRVGMPTLSEAGERLRAGVSEWALHWRAGWQPALRVARPGEVEFLATSSAGGSLARALEASPSFDFGAWLPLAVSEQLVIGADPMHAESEGEFP